MHLKMLSLSIDTIWEHYQFSVSRKIIFSSFPSFFFSIFRRELCVRLLRRPRLKLSAVGDLSQFQSHSDTSFPSVCRLHTIILCFYNLQFLGKCFHSTSPIFSLLLMSYLWSCIFLVFKADLSIVRRLISVDVVSWNPISKVKVCHTRTKV